MIYPNNHNLLPDKLIFLHLVLIMLAPLNAANINIIILISNHWKTVTFWEHEYVDWGWNFDS